MLGGRNERSIRSQPLHPARGLRALRTLRSRNLVPVANNATRVWSDAPVDQATDSSYPSTLTSSVNRIE
jgi:hypothetical protein